MKHTLILFALFVLSFPHSLLAGPLSSPVVHTDSGDVQGRRDKGVFLFRGIPYAAPPVGALRWMPPSPPVKWDGVLQVRHPGPVCLQPYGKNGSGIKGSEDCLQLNVWSVLSEQKRPVMVFIHGGGFSTGSNEDGPGQINLYDGSSLVKQGGVVVVTIKYRLGALGFMAHPALSQGSPIGVSGNYGILDQIAALHWVQKNIGAFGGDPNRVTVFGESAGAVSVLDLISSPLAQGLFKNAIVESGYTTQVTQPQALKTGEKLAAKLGCTGTNPIECLRAVPAMAIVGADPNTYDSSSNPYVPYPDGKVLPYPVLETFQRGLQNKVPVIIGTNTNEASTLIKQFYRATVTSDTEMEKAVIALVGKPFWDAVKDIYTTANYGSAEQALIQLVTDSVFTCPMRQLLKAEQDNVPTWQYVFSHTSNTPFVHKYGAGHGMELLYVFHFVPRIAFGPYERALSNSMQQYWSRFAAASDPMDLNKETQTVWPRYEREHAQYLEFNEARTVHEHYRTVPCDIIDQVPLTPLKEMLE